jgi:hypothetical protein
VKAADDKVQLIAEETVMRIAEEMDCQRNERRRKGQTPEARRMLNPTFHLLPRNVIITIANRFRDGFYRFPTCIVIAISQPLLMVGCLRFLSGA